MRLMTAPQLGDRVWVKEWDEVWNVVGVNPLTLRRPNDPDTMRPKNCTIYRLERDEAPTPAGVFYQVATINWLGQGGVL